MLLNSAMSDSSRVHSQWDRLPTETALRVCRFLPALDLLNVCVAYPTIEQLVMNTRGLWQFVHLPFPDPLLHNYPGWRRCSSVLVIPDDSNPLDHLQYTHVSTAGSTSGSNSRLAIVQDDRFRSLSEPNYFDLPDIEGGEQDDREDNTAWILLDVLDRIPLRHIRHLSFENPPCHLCVYPCKRTCHCECHQNEHGDHAHRHQQRQCHYSAEYANNGGNNANAGPLGYIERDPHRPLSPPLQDLLDSGLVDFNQHINLRKLNEALATENARGLQGYSSGISNLSYPFHERRQPSPGATIHQNNHHSHGHSCENTGNAQLHHQQQQSTVIHAPGSFTLDQNNLQEAQRLLNRTDDAATSPSLSRRSSIPQGRDDMETSTVSPDTNLSEEDVLEQQRQLAETRAAYQRARLLIRILSMAGLDTLETLRAPWWPAARIYTIRQRLERWSFMIEQSHVSADTSPRDNKGDQCEFCTAKTNPGSWFVPWHTRWTNIDMDTAPPALSDEKSGNEIFDTNTDSLPLQPSHPALSSHAFPLPGLSRFILRSGGGVVSHERHSIGASALILSGRSSSTSPRSSTTLFSSNFGITDVDAVQLGSEAMPSVVSLFRPVFRYCHHCGSQYLQASTDSTNALRSQHKACFCNPVTPMSS